MADQVNQSIADAIRAPHRPAWYDDELLSRLGRAAHRFRLRHLSGDPQARRDLEARWQPVLKSGAADDAPVIDPNRARTYGDDDGLNFTVY